MCESGTIKSSDDERNQQQTKCDDMRWDVTAFARAEMRPSDSVWEYERERDCVCVCGRGPTREV